MTGNTPGTDGFVGPPTKKEFELAATGMSAVSGQEAKKEKERGRLNLRQEFSQLHSYTFSERGGQFLELFFALLSGLTSGNFENFGILKDRYNFGDPQSDPHYPAFKEPWEGMEKIANEGKRVYALPESPERTRQVEELQKLGGTYMEKMERILDFIGKAEGAGYNTIFGGGTRDLGNMTISEVYKLQGEMIANPKLKNSPVGKFQFNRETLQDYVGKLGIDPNTTKFTPEVQRRLAIARFQHQISSVPGVAEKKLAEFFDGATEHKNQIQSAMAQVWAGIADVTGKSFYHNFNGNKATTPGLKASPFLDSLTK